MTSAQSKSKSNKLPAPVYAAAGAGDFAYQQLRKLPAVVADLRERVAGNEVDIKADVERLRAAARRNAKVVAEAGQVAQDRAVAIYKDLVSRGEHVVAGTRPPLKVKATVEVKASPALETEPEVPAKSAPKAAKKATRPAAPAE